MQNLISAIHVITCLLIILVVLIQSGKGAEVSASFGGSSQTVFGASGGANFFQKFTGGLAAVFMVTSLVLTLMGAEARKSVFEGVPDHSAATEKSAPAGSKKQAPATAPQAPAAPSKSAPAK